MSAAVMHKMLNMLYSAWYSKLLQIYKVNLNFLLYNAKQTQYINICYAVCPSFTLEQNDQCM